MIKLTCDYAKKLGLPNYSSHQFSIRLETEIADESQVQTESARLYKLLQEGVDSSIQETGFLPEPTKTNGNGNGSGNGYSNGYCNGNVNGNGNGYSHSRGTRPVADSWRCSSKQKDLILKIIEENALDKNEIEQLAQDRFSKGVKFLNKLEAGGLISELIELYPSQNGRRK